MKNKKPGLIILFVIVGVLALQQLIVVFELVDLIFSKPNGFRDSYEERTENNDALYEEKYLAAMSLWENEAYEEAEAAFQELGNYKDSDDREWECREAIINKKYLNAISLMNEKKYDEAMIEFWNMYGYKDSEELIYKCGDLKNEDKYNEAKLNLESGNIIEAYEQFGEIHDFRDCSQILDSIREAYNEAQYNKGLSLYQSGDYDEALAAFWKVGDYKDCDFLKWKCNFARIISKFKATGIREQVTFGTYKQNNNSKDKISWKVLLVSSDKVLLLSEYALDYQPFDYGDADKSNWSTCSLRKWLNETFLNEAFTDDEREVIVSTSLYNDESIVDKVFLLKMSDAKMVSSRINGRNKCMPTKYAATSPMEVNDFGMCCWWILPDILDSKCVPYVDFDGTVLTGPYPRENGGWYSSTGPVFLGVRPAIWVSLDLSIID